MEKAPLLSQTQRWFTDYSQWTMLHKHTQEIKIYY